MVLQSLHQDSDSNWLHLIKIHLGNMMSEQSYAHVVIVCPIVDMSGHSGLCLCDLGILSQMQSFYMWEQYHLQILKILAFVDKRIL